MDLWEKFGMSEGIAELWQELGISAGWVKGRKNRQQYIIIKSIL